MDSPSQKSRLGEFIAQRALVLWIGQAIVLLAIGFVVAWGVKTVSFTPLVNGSTDPQVEAPQIWTCAMHPQIRRDGPGKCPLCGMDLVPVKASSGGLRTVSISPAARKLMNIETTPVQRRIVTADVRMFGKIEYDETRLSHITAWVSGRLDRLYVDYTGIEVKAGDHLAYIYSEELYSAQEELLQAIKNRRQRPPTTTTLIQPIDLAESSREKLRLLGLTIEQIQELEQRGTPTDHMTIYSPIGGVVIDKLRQEGDRVRTGDRIYSVADLNQVWVKLDAYESDLAWLRYGQEVEFVTEAYPGEKFVGRIAFIDPVLDKSTRTVKVRVNVANKEGRLKPEMFVRAVVQSQIASGGRVLDANLIGKWISPMHPEILKDEPGLCDICGMPLVRAETLGYTTATPHTDSKPLVIPVTAALVTGTRAIVYVEIPTAKEPTFEGREIVLGPRAGEYYLVRSGLKEGDLVVTNGNFKLDSALQISAKPSMMTPEGGGGGGHDHGGHGGDQQAKPDTPATQQMQLPAPFRSQLTAVFAAHDELTAAVEDAELAKIRASFNGLGTSLAKVDSKLVVGHPQMLWREFQMLLTNDFVEGREVATLESADRVYLQTKRHIQRVREQFGLLHQSAQDRITKINVPAEFQNRLLPVVDVYFALHSALSADNAQLAFQSVPALPQTLAAIDASMLDEKSFAVWKKELKDLNKIAGQMSVAVDIKTLREAFALLSDEVLVIVRTFGLEDKRPIYELHCPMAFQGRGASWLQSDKLTKNPYYGATMLKCADRVELLAPPTDEHKSHDKHQH